MLRDQTFSTVRCPIAVEPGLSNDTAVSFSHDRSITVSPFMPQGTILILKMHVQDHRAGSLRSLSEPNWCIALVRYPWLRFRCSQVFSSALLPTV